MVKRVCCLFLVVWLLAAPVLAAGSTEHPNSVGAIQQELVFYGFSVGDCPASPQYLSVDGYSVSKDYSNADDDLDLNSQSFYFYFFWPELADEMTLDGTVGLSVSGSWLVPSGNSLNFYGATRTAYNTISLTLLNDTSVYMSARDDSLAFKLLRPVTVTDNDYYLLIVEILTSGSVYLDRSISFSESSTITGSSSGSGSWKVNSVPSSSYMPYSSSSVTNNTYALFQQREINGVTYFFLNRASSGTNSSLASNPFTNLFQGTSSDSSTLSLRSSGSITPSSTTSTMAYAMLSVTYGNDGGLVDEVFDQGETLDDIAGNMQQVVDDLQAHYDTAQDIGGATSEDQITGTQETMSSGMSGLSSGLEVVQDMSTVSAPSTMYINLLTATVSPMLNFGNGVLYWALFAVIIGSVILFILRRLE